MYEAQPTQHTPWWTARWNDAFDTTQTEVFTKKNVKIGYDTTARSPGRMSFLDPF